GIRDGHVTGVQTCALPILQMAAVKVFGRDKWDALDRFTVSMAHPDAMAALLSGRSEVNSHFTLPPFTYQELADPRVHRVLSSYEIGRASCRERAGSGVTAV